MRSKDDSLQIDAPLFCPAEWSQISDSLGLTNRESEVVQGVLEDMSQAEIAQQLGISPHTVHAHLERVYNKVGVRSRVQLLVRVFSEYTSLSRAIKCIASSRLCPLRRGRLTG